MNYGEVGDGIEQALLPRARVSVAPLCGRRRRFAYLHYAQWAPFATGLGSTDIAVAWPLAHLDALPETMKFVYNAAAPVGFRAKT